MRYRTADLDDLPRILRLYKAVARVEGSISRLEREISEDYVREFITESMSSGVIIVGEHPHNPDELVAEIHGYKSGLYVFDHVLGGVTLAVHPDHQGKKIGRTILTIFLEEVANNRADIGKVELMTREGNERALNLYQSMGFRIEGRLEMRIRTPDRNYEADIPMGWQNPNFEFDF